jgi:hypothetical protein
MVATVALFLEYEAVLTRPEHLAKAGITVAEAEIVLDMKTFCQDLSAVAMRAIKTDQFVEEVAREDGTTLNQFIVSAVWARNWQKSSRWPRGPSARPRVTRPGVPEIPSCELAIRSGNGIARLHV